MIKMSVFIVLSLIVFIFVELFLHPRIDKTDDGKIILWYVRRIRYYIILWNEK